MTQNRLSLFLRLTAIAALVELDYRGPVRAGFKILDGGLSLARHHGAIYGREIFHLEWPSRANHAFDL